MNHAKLVVVLLYIVKIYQNTDTHPKAALAILGSFSYLCRILANEKKLIIWNTTLHVSR